MLSSRRSRPVLRAVTAIATLVALGMPPDRTAVAGKPGGGGTTTTYTLTDLKGFPDGDSGIQGYARGVGNPDAAGVVKIVGGSHRADRLSHAALWTAAATGAVQSLTDLGNPSGHSECAAVAINDSGLIVGTNPAFVVIPGIGLKVLPSIYGTSSEGGAVNKGGDVVGYDEAWHVDALGNVTGPINLGTFFASDINDAGVMAGSQNSLPAIAQFDTNGTLQVRMLSLLPGDNRGYAYAINNAGAVVGQSSADVSSSHAFLWTPDDRVVSLPDLGGGKSIANDINDKGQIIGRTSKPRGGIDVPCLWENGKVSDLNVLCGAGAGLTVMDAQAINATGHIVGYLRVSLPGRIFEQHAYLLTPKP